MDELYYEHPVQVKFWDVEANRYIGGIAYHDIVICGYDGLAISIQTIIDNAVKMAKLEPDDAIVELDWIDISEEIIDG